MSKTIFNLFKNYYSQLSKLELVVASKTDLVAIEETVLKATFTPKVILLLLLLYLYFSY
jgi:hypothetical protein